MPATKTLAIGSLFQDRYKLLAQIGEGGFGTIYRARQQTTGQLVAVKVVRLPRGEETPLARESRLGRFQREMQLCAQLHHPNIVRLVDSGQADGEVLYSVFQLVPGRDLRQVLAEDGALAPRESKHLMLQVIDAMACAHAAGVVHRDLKPANVMLVPTGARRNAVVLDFGIGAIVGDARLAKRDPVSSSNESVGTPAYAAPEQLRGEPPTPRSDLYAWALLFLECLTGKRAVPGDSTAETIANQLSPTPVEIPPRIAAHPVGDILRRALTKDVALRDATAADLLRELEACDVSGLAETSVTSLSAADRTPRTPSRSSQGPGSRVVQGERRQITAMCCTLAASSVAHHAHAPEDLDHVLGLQQEAFTLIARRWDAHVAGALGDAVLLYFGYPMAREDDARRAAHAALEMVADVKARSARFEEERGIQVTARFGIHTGLVVSRELRDTPKDDLGFVAGATPKLAVALSALAERDRVLVSSETQKLLRKHFVCTEPVARGPSVSMGPQAAPNPARWGALEGIAAPVPCCELTAETPAADVFDVPLVARQTELATLSDRWWRARGGSGQTVLLTGEPGVGKSRLVRALAEALAGDAHVWLECRCSPATTALTFYPLADALSRRLDPTQEDPPTTRAAKLEALLSQYPFDLREAMPLFSTLLALPLQEPWAPLDVSPQKRAAMTRNAVLSLFFEMAERDPMVLVVEDLQWADPATLDLLQQLTAEVAASPVLVLLTARPELVAPWAQAAVAQILVDRLDRPAVEEFAKRLAGDHALPPEAVELVAGRSDGVPLFVEELVLHLIETGAIARGEEAWTLAKPTSDVVMPATLRDSLVARLDRLGRAKETAQIAAAIGREVTLDLLIAIAVREPHDVEADLEKLVLADLLHRKRRLKKPTFLFKHALVRDAAYESMLKRSRRDVHARIAAGIEDKFPEIVADRPDVLAHHHAAAEQRARAVPYAQRAATAALGRFAYGEAITQARQAIGWLDALEDEKARVDAELACNALLTPSLMATQGFATPDLAQVLARSRSLIAAIGESEHVFPNLWALVLSHYTRGEIPEALSLAERFLSLARAGTDTGRQMVGLSIVGVCHLHLGHIAEAIVNLTGAVRLHDPAAHRDHVLVYGMDCKVFALSYLAAAEVIRGHLDAGRAHIQEQEAWTRQIKSPHVSCSALYGQAWYYQLIGDRPRVLACSDELRRVVGSYGFSFYLPLTELMRAWAEGNADAAVAMLGQFEASRAVSGLGVWTSMAVAALLDAGRGSELLDVLDKRILHHEDGSTCMVPELLRLQAEILAGSDPERAEPIFRRAIALAGDQEGHFFGLHAAAGLARLLLVQGRNAEALSDLGAAFERIRGGDAVPSVADARALFTALNR